MKQTNLLLTFSLTFLSLAALAQTDAPAETPSIPEPSLGLTPTELLIVALLIFAFVLLLVSVTLYNAFKVMLNEQKNPTPYVRHDKNSALGYGEWVKDSKSTPTIWTKILGLRPIEEEKNIEIPHSYDGIKELNNPIPTWFNVLFYGTIIFGVIYLYYYHVGGYGERQDDEYVTEMTKADLAKQQFLAKSSSSVDENSVKIDPAQIVSGKVIFDANCVACHGEKGEGLVGPNLTDEYTLHGGSVKDIFKVVKYGVPEKGMVSWEKNMSSANISAVTNYILSLQGTNPANAKAPQGQKYDPAAAAEVAAD